MEVKRMSPFARQLLYWSPRILCIAFAIFLSLFALDVFSEGYGFGETALAFLIHLIPAGIVVAVLLIAWRWEWIGAVLFTAAAAIYGVPQLVRHPSWVLGISVPMLVIAGLFLLNWIKRSELRPAR
jgi:zinc transporter ZupT